MDLQKEDYSLESYVSKYRSMRFNVANLNGGSLSIDNVQERRLGSQDRVILQRGRISWCFWRSVFNMRNSR